MYIFLSLFIFLGSQGAYSNTPLQEDYPRAGAVILLDRQVLEIKKDFSTSLTGELVVKIFNDRGKIEYADIKRRYDANTQKFEVLTAQTHSPDGKKTQVEKDAISDISADEVMYASAYTNARIKVVSFPAIEPGAVIEYKYKIKGKKSKKPLFFGEVVFADEEPILKKEFKLITPETVEFNYKLVDGTLEPLIGKIDGKNVYTWELSDIPAIISEPYMPSFAEFAPRLVYSSFTSWDELAEWLGKQFYKSVGVNKEMKKEVEKIANNKETEEIIRDIFLLVTTEFRNINLRLGLAGYSPTKAKKVWFNKYGDPRDKTVLLYSLLKSAGIKAFPIFINDKNIPIIKEVPSPSMFNWLILAIPLDDENWFLMDPMAVNSELGYLPEGEQGVEGLVVFQAKEKEKYIFKQTLQLPKEKSLSYSSMKLSVSPEGNLKGDVATELTGFYGRKARRAAKNKTQKEKKMWMESGISAISTDAELLSYLISDLKDLTMMAQLNFSFSAQKFATIEDENIHFFVPENPYDFANLSAYTGLSKRQYPLLLRTHRIIRSDIEIEIPYGFTIDWLPEPVAIENELGSVNIKASALDNKIVYTREFVFKKRRIDTSEYSEFTSLTAEFLKRSTRMVILKPTLKKKR